MSANAAGSVYFVVPDTIDDPDRVSGGNVYDQHLRDGLTGLGWRVCAILISEDSGQRFALALAELPDGATVLVDGLVAVAQSATLIAHSGRLRVIVLAHMVASILSEAGSTGRTAEPDPRGTSLPEVAGRERRTLHAAERVIATSQWTRTELIARRLAEPQSIVVAPPGTDPAAATTASDAGDRLLCVGAVAPHKGQDLLVDALLGLADIAGWTCTFAGALGAAPEFVAGLTRSVGSAGLTDRIAFTGVLTGQSLADAYASTDLVVAPSRVESYGMAVAEAVARGIPVIAARTGGLPEAISQTKGAIIVPPDDAPALDAALRHWWAAPSARATLKAEALKGRASVRPWATTTSIVSSTLEDVAHARVASTA